LFRISKDRLVYLFHRAITFLYQANYYSCSVALTTTTATFQKTISVYLLYLVLYLANYCCCLVVLTTTTTTFRLQVALVICGLFICDFPYMRSRNGLFSGTYPLINSHPWSFYMRIHYMRAYFWSPYLSHITRATCTASNNVEKKEFQIGK